MDSGQIFLLTLIAISTLGWLFSNWIRARHGYPLEDGKGHETDKLELSRKTDLIAEENGRLKDQVGRLEERVAVLERIITDRSRTLSDEIDALR
ncbi:hypothetical protein [Flavisphingomonas formosensis]|uniref:hypothetical protein n=1 Tax=Flavisphingomonas formosensis TaxID=861534 RepID=UPI0012FA4620|nr:hypothetical protein [Sphingomonas formosensis]